MFPNFKTYSNLKIMDSLNNQDEDVENENETLPLTVDLINEKLARNFNSLAKVSNESQKRLPNSLESAMIDDVIEDQLDEDEQNKNFDHNDYREMAFYYKNLCKVI